MPKEVDSRFTGEYKKTGHKKVSKDDYDKLQRLRGDIRKRGGGQI